jgi:hypothetical protein
MSCAKEPPMTCAEKHRDQKRYAVERIREDESLTADLVDEAAEILLDWSAAQVEAACQGAEPLSQAELSACVARLRRLLRRINMQAGQARPDKQAQRVRYLLTTVASGEENADEG